jgi:hypothetical protein
VLGDRVVLKSDQQAARQRAGEVRAPARMPVRQRLDQAALGVGHRLARAKPDRGEKVGSLWIGQHADQRLIAERSDREPQAEQRGAAADQHLPAVQVAAEPAGRIGI